MSVHTWPRCDLRFEREVELKEHLRVDHGVEIEDPASVSDEG